MTLGIGPGRHPEITVEIETTRRLPTGFRLRFIKIAPPVPGLPFSLIFSIASLRSFSWNHGLKILPFVVECQDTLCADVFLSTVYRGASQKPTNMRDTDAVFLATLRITIARVLVV